MHLGWVPNETGGYRGQMAVLVKPNGLFGRAYMGVIGPFRHLIVYPPLMREIGREWGSSAGEALATPAATSARGEACAAQSRVQDRPPGGRMTIFSLEGKLRILGLGRRRSLRPRRCERTNPGGRACAALPTEQGSCHAWAGSLRPGGKDERPE